MALDRNSIFFYNFTGDEGGMYQLQFIPSDDSDLSTPTETGFAPNTISEIKQDLGYPDQLHYGMPKAPELSFKLDLSNIDDDDLKEAILEGAGVSKDIFTSVLGTAGTVTKDIPNQWKLLKSNDSGSTYTIKDFWGCQNSVPTLKTTIKNKNSFEQIEIKATDLFHKVTQDIVPSFAGLDVDDYVDEFGVPPSYERLWYLLYFVGAYSWSQIRGKTGNWGQYYEGSNAEVFGFIQGQVQSYLRAYTRDITFALNTDITKPFSQSDAFPYWHWLVFEQDTSSSTGARGSQIADTYNDVHNMIYIDLDANQTSLGLLAINNESGLAEFESLKDVFMNYAEGCGAKLIVDYNPASDDMSYVYHRLNDRTLGGDQKELKPDYVDANTAQTIGNIEMEYNFEMVNECTSHYKSIGDDDINEFTVLQDKTLSQDSFEIAVIPQTSPTAFAPAIGWSRDTTGLATYPKPVLDRNLYYVSTTFFIATHDNVRVMTDGSNYVEGANSYTKPTDFADVEAFRVNWNTYVANTAIESGSGYIIAKLYSTYFATKGQSLIKCKLKKTNAEANMLGDKYLFTIGDFTADSYFSKVGTDAFLVSNKIDYQTEICEVEFFVKGADATI